MSSVLGVSAAGIGMGGTVALLQAAAATGAPLAPVLAPVVLPVLAVGAAGVAGVAVAGVAVANRVNEVRTLPKGRTGEPTRAAGRYVVAAHDFGTVLYWQSDDLEAAKSIFESIELRHILFDLDGDAGKPTLVHGVTRKWNEMKHDGWGCHVDNHIRRDLQEALDKDWARTLPKDPTGEPTRAAGRYVVAAHDFGDVLFWQSDDLEAAKTVFRDLRLRRILFDLDGDGGKPTLVHGVTREWNEMKHEGEAPHVDKEIRHALQAALDKERARKTHVQ